MTFNTYDEFKNAVASEKISLVLIYPRKSINTFTNVAGNVWKKTISNIVSSMFSGPTQLTKQTSSSVDVSNPWFYDISTNELYYYTTSTSPDDDNLIAEYILHYSNSPITLSYDLGDLSEQVYYEPRLLKTIGFKSEIGSDQKGISITGGGTLSIENNDGHFDSFFDSFTWENKRVEVYSYNTDLNPSDAKLQYKGFIVSKAFNLDKVSFKVKDSIFKLDTTVSMNLFTASDGVGPSYIDNVKRQIYGRADGVLCRSVDQVGDGYSITGTVSGTINTGTLTGSGTLFLTELAMNDEIIINNVKYTIQEIASDTSLTISDTDGLVETLSGVSMTSLPSTPNPEFNREFFVADHAILQTNSTITSMNQLNRFTVADINGFEVGDTIRVDGLPFTIFNISGDQIQTSVNADEIFPNGTVVTKEPITNVYINGVLADIRDLSNIVNTTDCKFTLSNTAEYSITNNELVDDAFFAFTNGSREIVYSGLGDLGSLFIERDWIKAEGDADAEYIKIVDIVGNTIRCSTNYNGATASTQKAIKRRPNYIDDSSAVSVDCFGRTDDGTSTGNLLKTGSSIVRQLLIDIGLESELDISSFEQASIDNNMRMSIMLPYDISSDVPNIKDVINSINQTIFGSLALKQDMTLSYTIKSAERVSTIVGIADDDVIKWKSVGKNTDTYKRVFSRYKFIDYDNNKKSSGSSLVEFSSDKVVNFDISNKDTYRNFRVYDENDAIELSQRFIHFNEQSLMEMDIESDLRLENLEINDKVKITFNRFTQSNTSEFRIFTVISVKKQHNEVKLVLSDSGNIYIRSSVISDNTALDYSSASLEERAFASYITDENGIVTGFEETKDNNLIT